jgi:hypothetical protein
MTIVATNDLGRKAYSLQRRSRASSLRTAVDQSRRSYPARIKRSLRPSTRSRSVAGRSWKKQLMASTMTRHCERPVTALRRVQAGLELHRDADTELRVVLDLFAFFGAGGWPAGTTAILCFFCFCALFRHGRVGWRGTSECAHSAAHWTRAGIVELSPANTTCRDVQQR